MTDERVELAVQILKAVPAKQIVFGWLFMTHQDGRQIVDKQGHTISQAELEEALHDYVLNGRQVGEMHERLMSEPGTGVVEALMLDDVKAPLIVQALAKGQRGALVALKVDRAAFARIRAGELLGFSLGGSGIVEDAE